MIKIKMGRSSSFGKIYKRSEARNADCTGTILFLTPTVSAPITPLECSIPIRSA
uniref:Uncharacterized protein n=1 Tax=Meloidogyne enterolobii TaxID=390850 RepID=A0A6V7XRP6_MELEN|nr:unnamed protein product [Meloidogyne enterolobii]